MSIKINQGAINRYFQRAPLAGVGAPGLRSGSTERIAARMIGFVKAEIKLNFNERTGDLLDSLEPVIKPDPRGGVRVGVRSTIEYAKYLTEGTSAHAIPKEPLKTYYLRSNGPRSKGPNPTPLLGQRLRQVQHPGNKPNDFIRRGVNLAIGRPLP